MYDIYIYIYIYYSMYNIVYVSGLAEAEERHRVRELRAHQAHVGSLYIYIYIYVYVYIYIYAHDMYICQLARRARAPSSVLGKHRS